MKLEASTDPAYLQALNIEPELRQWIVERQSLPFRTLPGMPSDRFRRLSLE